eukprot:2221839-Amphidinium_carterae.2
MDMVPARGGDKMQHEEMAEGETELRFDPCRGSSVHERLDRLEQELSKVMLKRPWLVKSSCSASSCSIDYLVVLDLHDFRAAPREGLHVCSLGPGVHGAAGSAATSV